MSIHDFRKGQIFYGEKLRRHLEAQSPIERATSYWDTHEWPVRVLGFLGMVVCAGILAMWIVGCRISPQCSNNPCDQDYCGTDDCVAAPSNP